MLPVLIAAGVIAVSGGALEPGSGTVDVPADMTAIVRPTAASTGSGTGVPATAFAWSRPLDPSDRARYAFDFSQLLGDAKIATIERIQMTALGTSLGVMIDDDTYRLPVIDTEGKIIGVGFRVLDAFQFNASFATAVRVGVAFQITTDETPSQTFERSGVLTVVQQ